jgi:hypothetical protein
MTPQGVILYFEKSSHLLSRPRAEIRSLAKRTIAIINSPIGSVQLLLLVARKGGTKAAVEAALVVAAASTACGLATLCVSTTPALPSIVVYEPLEFGTKRMISLGTN